MLKMIQEFLLQPEIFVGVIALSGLFLQKKSFEDIIKGTTKAMIGFMIIRLGGDFIAEAMEPFAQMFQKAFNVEGTLLSIEGVGAIAIGKYGTDISIIMVLGMLVNLILAKVSRFRYVFVTGHQALYMASMLVIILNAANVKGVFLVLIGSLTLGTVMVLSPAIVQKYTSKILKNDSVAMGHFGGFSYLTAAWLGKIYGENSKSTEDMKLPKKLSFLRELSVTLCLVLVIMYIIVASAAGKQYIESTLSSGQNYIVYCISLALRFTGGFVVITTGIRWFINEIVPAIKGIADTWIPNAKAAVDCPVVFAYAPNAVMIGFLSSFFAGILSMLVMSACNLTIILPGIVAHFFSGATAGVYGNSTGGRRGAILGGFVNGIYISVFPLFFLRYFGGDTSIKVTFPDSDIGLVGSFLGDWINRIGIWGTLTIVLGIMVIMVLIPEMIEDRDESPEDGLFHFDREKILKESKISEK
ncbi:MAG: PTS ascorbate transporter subunit IIC [Anaerostipes sp.]|jgi:PTS system ascorbate-specific IIC component|nr:PTS ascorbate transporter subunit IIC [Anaerostipes sp.]